MEKKIREYERFIAKESAKKMSAVERAKLYELHRDTVDNFQKERLIHLIVMFFFAAVSIFVLVIVSWMVAKFGFILGLLPLYVLTLVLIILTTCYVRHYYFLENHIQGLYKYFDTLMK